MTWPMISDEPGVQARYEGMRAAGESHGMAEVLATRNFPGTRGTDRAFMQGRHLDGSQFDGLPPKVGRDYVAAARAAGVNPCGKYYCGTLARRPGDPEAWVDSLADVRRICEGRGWGATGAVNVAAPKYAAEEPAPYRPAEDLVAKYVDEAMAVDPGAKREDVTEAVSTRLAGVKR